MTLIGWFSRGETIAYTRRGAACFSIGLATPYNKENIQFRFLCFINLHTLSHFHLVPFCRSQIYFSCSASLHSRRISIFTRFSFADFLVFMFGASHLNYSRQRFSHSWTQVLVVDGYSPGGGWCSAPPSIKFNWRYRIQKSVFGMAVVSRKCPIVAYSCWRKTNILHSYQGCITNSCAQLTVIAYTHLVLRACWYTC